MQLQRKPYRIIQGGFQAIDKEDLKPYIDDCLPETPHALTSYMLVPSPQHENHQTCSSYTHLLLFFPGGNEGLPRKTDSSIDKTLR